MLCGVLGVDVAGPEVAALRPHTTTDITNTWTAKQCALAAHTSQPITEHFQPMAETLARLWGARIGATHAENVTPIPILGRLPAAATL